MTDVEFVVMIRKRCEAGEFRISLTGEESRRLHRISPLWIPFSVGSSSMEFDYKVLSKVLSNILDNIEQAIAASVARRLT